jgi:hypothetical protein
MVFGKSQDMSPIHTALGVRLQFALASFPIGQFTAREDDLEFRAEAGEVTMAVQACRS